MLKRTNYLRRHQILLRKKPHRFDPARLCGLLLTRHDHRVRLASDGGEPELELPLFTREGEPTRLRSFQRRTILTASAINAAS